MNNMTPSRRSFLLGAAATTALGHPSKLLASITAGSGTLMTVSDGSLVLPGSFFFDGLPAQDLSNTLAQYGIDQERLEPECNLAILQDGESNILFDVGSGADFVPSAGKIVDSLDAMGLTPEDITHVVFTHAHPDHIWGLLDEFDDPLFYEAEYFIGRKEWDYWWNPETVNTIGEARAAFAVGAKRRLEAIEESVVLFDAGDEVLPGVQAVASFGHTPGHMAFDVHGKALVVGDAIGNHHVAFHHPDWPSGADQIADAAVASRKMLLDRLSTEQMALVGFHLPNGGIGRVDAKDGAYRFIQEG